MFFVHFFYSESNPPTLQPFAGTTESTNDLFDSDDDSSEGSDDEDNFNQINIVDKSNF